MSVNGCTKCPLMFGLAVENTEVATTTRTNLTPASIPLQSKNAVSETPATTGESASGNDTALAVSQEGLASCDVQPGQPPDDEWMRFRGRTSLWHLVSLNDGADISYLGT